MHSEEGGRGQASVGRMMRGSWVILAGWAGTGDGLAVTGSVVATGQGEKHCGSMELSGLPSQSPASAFTQWELLLEGIAVLPVPWMAGGMGGASGSQDRDPRASQPSKRSDSCMEGPLRRPREVGGREHGCLSHRCFPRCHRCQREGRDRH